MRTKERRDRVVLVAAIRDQRAHLLSVIRYCALVFLLLRLLTLVVGVVAVGLVPALDPVGVPGWPAPIAEPGWHNLFTAWERFDALWFLRIADEGYRLGDGSAAFFPLFPLVVRAVSFVAGGHPFGAALVVSNLAFLAALVVTYLLTDLEYDERRARATVVLLAFFPTSFFFLMPYSESLFLLLAVAAFWFARRGSWVGAGIAGALAALTRSVGIALAPAIAIEALHQRAEGRGRAWPGLLAAVATAGGTLAYLGSWELRAGDLLAPLHTQQSWERTFSWPWASLWEGTRTAFRYVGDTNGGYWLLDWLIVIPFLAAAAYALARSRPSYGVYLLVTLLIPLSFVFEDRTLMSMPRFVLVVFPAFWAAAEVVERRRVPALALAAIGTCGIGLLSVLTVNWYYVF
ncbi:MAG TPA: mannosyltransferase family protein [Actinomycetota bacterium]|nr:mannosyltransferase family protein [Actinomycetota bacterium]